MKETLTDFSQPLIEWYEATKRPLPWREDREPYHVWISEIMLQQTRIEAVIRYYQRFMQALPNIKALSEVDDDTLMKLWEGLGYYSRARNLKKAAITIMTDFSGVFPTDFDSIRSLSGIGDYTAGAIASICFSAPVTAVDGNVLRVLSRVTASRENVLLAEVKKKTAEKLKTILPENSGAFNEALMELGEVVCLPFGAPLCESCPLSYCCKAKKDGLWEEIPVRIKRQKRTKNEKTVFVLMTKDGDVAIEKRPDSGLLSGLYQLPNIEGYYSVEELKSGLESWGLKPLSLSHLVDAKHVFTHIDWLMKAYSVTVEDAADRFLWVSAQQLKDTYPLPTAFSKILKAAGLK